MLSNLFTFVKAKGSSLPLPAHGWVGARATSSLAAHFAKQNTNSVGVQSEGEAEGGCGGNSASPEPKRSVKILRSDFRGKKFGFRSAFGAKLYVQRLLPRRFAPRQADCIVFAKIFWVQSPPFAKAKSGSPLQSNGQTKVCEPILLLPPKAENKAIIFFPKAIYK